MVDDEPNIAMGRLPYLIWGMRFPGPMCLVAVGEKSRK